MNDSTIVDGSAWIAIVLYTWTVIRLAVKPSPDPGARIVWSAGCGVFVLHVLSAFGVVYGWSHDEAFRQTAIQTRAATGFGVGWGLYLNYAFGLIWFADSIWWWTVGDTRYQRRRRVVFGVLHVFFLFMIVNGAFVFVDGWRRFLGLVLFGCGACAVYRVLKRGFAGSPS